MNAEQLAEKLVLWVRDKVLAAGCKGVVVGMSGGLDSSVLAVLCHRAFPENMLGVIMPCHSRQEDKAHAQAVASKFSIPTAEVFWMIFLLPCSGHYLITRQHTMPAIWLKLTLRSG